MAERISGVLVVIAYDVRDDRRRTKLAEALADFGFRVQLSVFEALLEPEQVEALAQGVLELIEPEEDSVRLYRVCGACEERVEILGQGERTEEVKVYIV